MERAELEPAVRCFEEAAGRLDATGAFADLAAVYVDWGRLLNRDREPTAAAEMLGKARAIWTGFGNRLRVTRVEAVAEELRLALPAVTGDLPERKP